MTPSQQLLKAAHMALEGEAALLAGVRLDGTHQVVIRLKPRGGAIRGSVAVESVEREL